jgi:apolipoprotein N-acyltransferase
VVSKLNRNQNGLIAGGAIVLTGLLTWYGTGLHPIWFLTWLAPIPILWLAPRVPGSIAFLSALFAWTIGNLNQWNYDRNYIELPVAVMALAILAPSFVFALAVLLYRIFVVRDRCFLGALAFPSLWVGFEFALQRLSPHSTWGSLAYTQVDCLPILQIASLTGLLGITFVTLFGAAAMSATLSNFGGGMRAATKFAASIAAVLLVLLAWGTWRIHSFPERAPEMKVGLVATDIPELLSPRSASGKEKLFRKYAESIKELSEKGAQVVVLPEKIIRIDDQGTHGLDDLLGRAGEGKTTIIVGVERWTTQAKLNESRVYGTDGRLLQTYEKHHMLPQYEAHLLPGTSLTTLALPAGKCGVTICKDMDFPALSRQYGQNSVGLQFVSAWDFVLDGYLHSRMAIMRSVESGFSLARSAKQGQLTLSDNRGRVLSERSTSGADFPFVLASIPVFHSSTLYSKWGDWFSWCNVGLLVLLLVLATRRNTIQVSGVGESVAQKVEREEHSYDQA